MGDFLHGYVVPTAIIVAEVLAIMVPLLIAIAYLTYAERKVLAAMQLRRGPNVVGPFGPAAALRRRAEAAAQGDRDPERRQPRRLHRRPHDHLHPRHGGLGGDPLRAGHRSRQYQRRHPLSLRHFLARRLRHRHGRLGEQFEISLPGRAPLGGADGLLRGLHRLRHHHGAALRRLAEPLRHRAGPAPYLVRRAAAADVRHLLHLGRSPRPTGRPSI